MLLSAYQGVLARDRSGADLVQRYKSLLEDMTGDQSSALVLSALAGAELAKRTSAGDRQAIKDLRKAVDLNSKSPKDYLLLSELQGRSGDPGAAINALLIAIVRFPYHPALYEKLAGCYLQAGNTASASKILRRGLELFPSDKELLQLAARAGGP